MTKKKENEVTENEVNLNPYYVEFKKTYNFEGETYNGIDLSNIEDLTANQLIEADKMLINQGVVDPVKEINLTYIFIIAYLVTGKPFEFFTNLGAKDAVKIKSVISNFLMD